MQNNQNKAQNTGISENNNLPSWSAFSPSARIIIVSPQSKCTPLKLLDTIGREMVRFRSWGRNGKVLGNSDHEKNFEFDHQLMKETSWENRKSHPQRIVFGLPHNYGKKEQHLEVKPVHEDRRASPLFIHIHHSDQQSAPIAIVTFLPALFLPEKMSDIHVGGKNVQLKKEDLWKPIQQFLDRLLNPHLRKEPFGDVREVTHD